MSNPIPVLLVTGFLGVGKTTFINYLLKNNPDKKISLILNEFGDIKLESQFIEVKGAGMVSELNNGCLCCVANVDLPRIIRYTLEHAPSTDQLIIEASGLSDPDPVRATLQSVALASLIRLDTTVVIVDSQNFGATATAHPLVMSQIADADLAVIAKASLTTETELAALRSRVESIGTGTKTLIWEEISDSSIFFDPPSIQTKANRGGSHSHEHFDNYIFQSQSSVDLNAMVELIKNLPSSILRIKGYIDVGDTRYLVQRVGHHVDVRVGVINSGDAHKVVILFLGTNLDIQAIESSLKQL